MSLSSLIESLLSHNESVIQWLVVVIVGMVAFLAARSVFKKPQAKPTSNTEPTSSESVEALLNQILEKTQGWAAQPQAPGPQNTEELEQTKKELAALKKALQEKEEQLKNNSHADAVASSNEEPTSASGTSENNKQYLEKISELEAKLAEYEVLEDDIADLSLYKEENARLKSEIERLSGGLSEEPSADASDIPDVPDVPDVPEPEMAEDLVKEFAEAVGKETPAVEPEAEPEPQVMAEEPGAPKPAAPKPAAPEPVATEPTGSVEDLFAESASSDLDTDKMVSELSEIEKMAESASAEEALASDVDADKIAEEAGEFKS